MHLPLLMLCVCVWRAGMVCKTAESLELLWARYPSKKWYLRVTDTAVIIPDNLLYHLRFTDPDQPWYAPLSRIIYLGRGSVAP